MTTENDAEAGPRTYCDHRCIREMNHKGTHFHGYSMGPDVPIWSARQMQQLRAMLVELRDLIIESERDALFLQHDHYDLAIELSDAYTALEYYENLLDAHGIET